MLCAELVGRDREVDVVRRVVAGARHGDGRLITLIGDAGAGKSRLMVEATAAARDGGVAILAGRAVPGRTPVPYRALTDALLGWFRTSPHPDSPELAGFGQHLGRLVPHWGAGDGERAEDSPVLVGEALVRLLRVIAGENGVLMMLEDLHWADHETMAVLDYLADALRGERVVCLCTSRPEGAAADLVERLARRDPNAVLPVDPLGRDDVDRMVSACLGAPHPPEDVATFVHAHSDGTPLLVEELLAGLVSAGQLRESGGQWESSGVLTPKVPASLGDSVRRRVAALDPTAQRVIGAASLLGRNFDWELLPGIAAVDGRSAADGLRSAVDAQLLVVDGGGFAFRHALTREAVLTGLLPPERRELATRAWPVHERANPGLPGPSLELAADLAEAAGERRVAVAHLIVSARRALDRGALATAEGTARRALDLAGAGSGEALDADEVLLQVLVAAGKAVAALALAEALALALATFDAPPSRRADVLVTATRAAIMAGDRTAAAAHVAAARAVAGDAVDRALSARLDAAAAAVAMEAGDLDAVVELAEAAAAGAASTGQSLVEGEALLLRGHVARTREGFDHALNWYGRAGKVAEGAGLARLHLQASQERAMIVWTSGDIAPLHEVRALAERYGARLAVAAADLGLADIALSSFDREGALAAASACADASRRYGLATESVAELWLAGAHALGGDRAAMHVAIDAALAPDPDDHRILADLYGRVLATAAFVDDEMERLPGLMATMIEHARQADPSRSVYPGRILWVVLEAADAPDAGASARDEFARASAHMGLRSFGLAGQVAEAIALGRAGDSQAANARFAPAYAELLVHPIAGGSLHSVALIAARAAQRDGWGEPVTWLREAEAFFAEGGYPKLVKRCRTMLGEAGAPVPRRGRGESVVPAALRARGVTSREVDVLKLVIAGCSNKEIAAQLVLSTKTVERHLSNLFTRLSVSSRHDLGIIARAHLGDAAS